MIDGCIVNTIKAIVDLYNEDFQYYKKFKYIDWTEVNTWDFAECNCASTEYINTYFNQQRFFDKLEFMDWAYTVISSFRDIYQVPITIVSSGYSPNLKAKELWIKKNLSFCDFIGVNLKKYNDKSHVKMGKGSVFMDDSANNLITSNAEYKICFGDQYPWNEDWKGIRCANWIDVFRVIKNLDWEGGEMNELRNDES